MEICFRPLADEWVGVIMGQSLADSANKILDTFFYEPNPLPSTKTLNGFYL